MALMGRSASSENKSQEDMEKYVIGEEELILKILEKIGKEMEEM